MSYLIDDTALLDEVRSGRIALCNSVTGYRAGVRLTTVHPTILTGRRDALGRFLNLKPKERPQAYELIYPTRSGTSIRKCAWPITPVTGSIFKQKHQLWLTTAGQLLLCAYEPLNRQVQSFGYLDMSKNKDLFSPRDVQKALADFCRDPSECKILCRSYSPLKEDGSLTVVAPSAPERR